MMGTSAKIILDSLHPERSSRLTTMEITFPRFILAEFNTHRAFSRNSASSRAIPVARQIERVRQDPFVPSDWPVNQAGMSASEVLADELDRAEAGRQWLRARDEAVEQASRLMVLGVHKQITNRLLEPFMWHTAIVSSTEWENFFRQRCSPLAQPEIRELAELMQDALAESTPRQMSWGGQWHMPYIQEDDTASSFSREQLRLISAARCARVSYLPRDGVRDLGVDLDLGAKLIGAKPPHASPLEHVAQPRQASTSRLSNFGPLWTQLRHELGM
jgi:hypothetical protein